MRRPALIAALLLLPAALTAQSHPLVGNWNLSLPVGMRVENDEPTVIMGKGTMTVTAVGDSLIATLTMEPFEGRPPRPAARMAAKLAADTVAFSYASTATLNTNGEESTRKAVSTYRFEVDGDTLKGTIDRTIEGLDVTMGGPQPITGKRAK